MHPMKCYRSFTSMLNFLISLSYIEGFGWPPLEAAVLGCPVICTKTGAIHDLLGNNARYVDQHNQKSINKVLFEALEKNSTLRPKVSLPSTTSANKTISNCTTV